MVTAQNGERKKGTRYPDNHIPSLGGTSKPFFFFFPLTLVPDPVSLSDPGGGAIWEQ